MKHYRLCAPEDGLLYVEVPTQNDLLNLLLQRRWRGRANLRTLHGYVPYYGGGIAFHFTDLLLKGVRPSWYCEGDYRTALQQLVADGYFNSSLEAERFHSIYPQECEWRGPAGMTFDLENIDHIWLGRHVGDPLSQDQNVQILEQILPADKLKNLWY